MANKSAVVTRLVQGDLSVIFYMSLLKLMLHISVNLFGGYGIFRDELYYLACADHPALGYVDHPPFSIYLLSTVTWIFGDSLFTIRLVAAIAGAITVFFIGLMTIRLGGNKFAQFMACACSFSLINLAMNSFYSMNSIDILCWTVVSYVMIIIIQDGNKKHWIVLGLILGVGVMNKIGVLFLGAGLFAGMLITAQRKWLATPWPYAAGIISFLFFIPYIVWNVQHDMAHLEFIRNASEGKYSSLSVLDFISGQFLLNNPFASFIWVAGLLSLLVSNSLQQYRLLAFLYLGPCIIFLLNGTSKAEYLAPAYSTLWAAGGVWIEKFLSFKQWATAYKTVVSMVVVLSGIVLMPMVLAVLPVERYIAYAETLGVKPSTPENKELAQLPQFYADMFGWEQKAITVSKVYQSLTEEEKIKCAIYGDNYGRCAAIDYFGKNAGLPGAIGSHNNYWIWGPRNYTGEVVIIVGGKYDDYVKNFEHVSIEATINCRYCMPYEDNMNIYLCRGLKEPLKDIWPRIKKFE